MYHSSGKFIHYLLNDGLNVNFNLEHAMKSHSWRGGGRRIAVPLLTRALDGVGV